MPDLTPVHVQRLRGAVEAAKSRIDVQFRVRETEPKTIGWVDTEKPRVFHVIANTYGDPEPMKAAIESAFLEMLLCGESN